MKNQMLLILIVILPQTSFARSTLKFVCADYVQGVASAASFDSEVPLFTSEVQVTSQDTIQRQYLTAENVCGMAMNFSKNCTAEIKINQGFTGFIFKCTNGISGMASILDGNSSFSCSGPGVSEEYANALFSGCETSSFE